MTGRHKALRDPNAPARKKKTVVTRYWTPMTLWSVLMRK
jgi:hypothetical protein